MQKGYLKRCYVRDKNLSKNSIKFCEFLASDSDPYWQCGADQDEPNQCKSRSGILVCINKKLLETLSCGRWNLWFAEVSRPAVVHPPATDSSLSGTSRYALCPCFFIHLHFCTVLDLQMKWFYFSVFCPDNRSEISAAGSAPGEAFDLFFYYVPRA